MEHKLYHVTGFQVIKPYALEIQFDDGVSRVVNFVKDLTDEGRSYLERWRRENTAT
jgi:hypothetical protein